MSRVDGLRSVGLQVCVRCDDNGQVAVIVVSSFTFLLFAVFIFIFFVSRYGVARKRTRNQPVDNFLLMLLLLPAQRM